MKTNVEIGPVLDRGVNALGDLIPEFLYQLNRLCHGNKAHFLRGSYSDLFKLVGEDGEWLDQASEETKAYLRSGDAETDLDTLVDRINFLSPPYVRFGEDERQRYGFWPDYTSIESDFVDGLLEMGEELPEPKEARAAWGNFLMVNERGNTTFYVLCGIEDSPYWEEVWSCV